MSIRFYSMPPLNPIIRVDWRSSNSDPPLLLPLSIASSSTNTLGLVIINRIALFDRSVNYYPNRFPLRSIIAASFYPQSLPIESSIESNEWQWVLLIVIGFNLTGR